MKSLIIIALMIFSYHILFAASGNKGNRHWWVKSYGQVGEEQFPAIKRAARIFEKTWKAAQPTTIKKPHLLILPASSEIWLDSWAVTIKDGTIILVQSILPLAFESDNKDPEYGDSRLAFILSHELAHLVHEDHKRLGVPLLFQAIFSEKELEIARQTELRADYTGLFLMTMAGYNPKHVLSERSVFFENYAKKIRKKIRSIGGIKNSGRHPETAERAEELRIRLKKFAEKLLLFHQGVGAYLKLDFVKAENNFEKFAAVYPGKEVLNNLGLSLYQQARDYVSGCQDLLYRLIPATLLVMETDARQLVPEEISTSVDVKKRDLCQPEKFKQTLVKSGQYLIRAIKKAPGYLPAKVNLSAIQIMNNEFKFAEQESRRSLSQQSEDYHLVINRALGLYQAEPSSHNSRAINLLKKVPESSPLFEIANKNLELMAAEKKEPMLYPVPAEPTISPEILDGVSK